MQTLLHQIKRELTAQRAGLLAWLAAVTLLLIVNVTGQAGEFHRAHSAPFIAQLLMLLDTVIAIGLVLLPAAVALEDPPADEAAHWRTLPLLPGTLLAAKLAAVAIGVAGPLLLARVLALIPAGATFWTFDTVLDFLSYAPSWVMVGFGFGALAGNWKRFAISVSTLLVGVGLLVVVIGQWADRSDNSLTPPFPLVFEDGLEHCFINNFFLMGTVVIVGLRYLTRLRGELITVAFLVCLPLGVAVAPFLCRPFVPNYEPPDLIGDQTVTAEYELPKQLLITTNDGHARLLGHIPYSGLKLTGVEAPGYLLPQHLDSSMLAESPERRTSEHFGPDRFPFPGDGAHRRWDTRPSLFMERHLSLARAVPGLRIINPPFEPGEGFNLFNLQNDLPAHFRERRLRLETALTVTPGRFSKAGELPLTVGATVSTNGTTIRIAALLPDAGDRTQIKVNLRHVQFVTDDNVRVQSANQRVDPRRHPGNLRYILANRKRGEACLATEVSSSSPQTITTPLAYTSTVLSFSIADGPATDLPIPAAWLAHAELHVFQALHGRRLSVKTTFEDIAIFSLPVIPAPQEINLEYR